MCIDIKNEEQRKYLLKDSITGEILDVSKNKPFIGTFKNGFAIIRINYGEIKRGTGRNYYGIINDNYQIILPIIYFHIDDFTKRNYNYTLVYKGKEFFKFYLDRNNPRLEPCNSVSPTYISDFEIENRNREIVEDSWDYNISHYGFEPWML